jgi:PST family polysaccharide transporter
MKSNNADSFEKFASPFTSGDVLRRKSVRGAFFMASAGGVEFAVRLVATLILARILAPEDFGLVAMVMVLTGLLDMGKDFGLGTATIQRKSITHREVSSLFWINVSFGGLLMLAFWAMTPVISWFYGDSRLILIALPLATTLLWGGMAVQHEALLNRQLKQGPLAFNRLLATLLSSCGGIVLALVGFGYWSLVVREVARSLIYLLGVHCFCRWRPALLFRPKEVREFLRFGKDLTFTFFAISIFSRLDGVLVGKFFGPEALGSYRQAQSLIMTPVEQLNAPVFSVAEPGLCSLQSEPDRYRRYYQRIVGFVSMVTMPIGVFAAVYPEDLTLVVLGEKWLMAAPFLGIFAVATALRPTIATTGIVLVTRGRSKVLLGLTLVHGLVQTLLMIAGIPWGALGIAVAQVATSFITLPLNLYYSFKGGPVTFRSFWSAIRMSLVSSVFMGVSLIVFRLTFPIAHSLPSLLAGSAIGATAYLLPWILLSSGRDQLSLILQDVKNSLSRRPLLTETSMVGKPQTSHTAT